MEEEKEVKVEEKAENKVENANTQDAEKKVTDIIKKAKEKGNITYGELATELGEVNPEQIDKVFDAMEEMGVDVLKDEQRNKALYACRRKTNRGCFCNKGFNRGSLYSSRYAKHGSWNEIVTIRSRPMYGYPYAVDS